jgi:hypothetical protein
MRTTVRITGAAMLALLLMAGCNTTQQIADQAPRAQTPMLTGLRAAPSATGTLVPVAAETTGPSGTVGGFPAVPGVFRVLPSGAPNGLPRGQIQVTFTAPSLLTLKVDVEGRPLYKFQDVPSNLDPLVVGYYRVKSVDASGNWLVTVRPPLSPIPRFALTINIATVSINPNHATGPAHESAPLVIKLASKPHRIGTDFSTVTGTCRPAPGLPRLRPGLTVRVADVGLTQVDVGCCHFPTQKAGIGGFFGTTAGANFPFPGLRQYALVMKLGTQPPGQGGALGSLVTNQAGQLELCINDENLADNNGAWGVDVRIDE